MEGFSAAAESGIGNRPDSGAKALLFDLGLLSGIIVGCTSGILLVLVGVLLALNANELSGSNANWIAATSSVASVVLIGEGTLLTISRMNRNHSRWHRRSVRR